MKTIFDHLRECAGNGDMPTLDAEDAQRIVETYDELVDALMKVRNWSRTNSAEMYAIAFDAINRATESRPLQIERD